MSFPREAAVVHPYSEHSGGAVSARLHGLGLWRAAGCAEPPGFAAAASAGPARPARKRPTIPFDTRLGRVDGECSVPCALEFRSCLAFMDGYDACRADLDSGVGKLAAAGCRPGCLDTAWMAQQHDPGYLAT